MKQHCSLCDCSVANYFIPTYGRGNIDAVITWVSCYAPSKKEYRNGGVYSTDKYLPLTKTLGEYGFGTNNSYFTHIIKCKLTRLPSELEITKCIPNIIDELSMMPNLKIIVLIGASVFKAFTGLSLKAHINKPIFGKYILIGIEHPHYIQANNTKYDLSMIQNIYNIIQSQ